VEAEWPGDTYAPDNGHMPVITRSSTTTDLARGLVVLVLAVVQLVVAGLGGSGATGESVGDVARSYPTPVLPAGWTFAIWGPIYLAFLGYAVYQVLPAQRGRDVHRATGWWLAASAVLNAGWILAFSARDVLLAELLLFALLAVLARVFGRLSRERASGTLERAALRFPVALYTGWVSLAVVAGTAATGVRLGLPGDGALATIAAVLILLVAAGIVASVTTFGTAVVGYAAAAVWALVGIALGQPPAAVGVAAAVATVVVLFATARRISTSGDPRRAAWG
jgi:benzodiazapine receptor